MDAAAQAAVGAGDDVVSADEFSERDDAVGHQFRVLDEIGGVGRRVSQIVNAPSRATCVHWGAESMIALVGSGLGTERAKTV